MGTSKMRFLFLLGALLVLFAEVAYPQGEDYQGKRGKHGFDFWKYYQGKRGKHGFLQGKRGKHGFIRDTGSDEDKLYGINMGVYDENNYNNHKSPMCSTDSDCGDGECCRCIGYSLHCHCGPCTDDNPDVDYQGKRGKHGFLQGKRGKHGFFSGGIDYQGKRGKHGFFSAGEDYQGKRGKHGFFSAGEDYQGIPLPCTVPKCY